MDNLFIVCYDIADTKRWRKVYRLMNGFGDWLQFSIFQCRLSRQRRVELEAEITPLLHQRDDHVMIINLGPADRVEPKVTSIGKPYSPIETGPKIF